MIPENNLRFPAAVIGLLGALLTHGYLYGANSSEQVSIQQIQSLPAPQNAIPIKPTSQGEKPLPSGYLYIAQELRWRSLYEQEAKRRRAAARFAPSNVKIEHLDKIVKDLEHIDTNSEMPPAVLLQDPQAVVALRGALARANSPETQWYILQALYACGDWNHRDELIQMIRNKNVEESQLLQLLALYHPAEGTQAALEILRQADHDQFGLAGHMSSALADAAFLSLERLKYPKLTDLYLKYFETWPAPKIAEKLGDLEVAQAKPMIEKAAAAAPNSLYFSNFASQRSYYYALAKLGDASASQWMLDKAKLLMSAPSTDDWKARQNWAKEHGITPEEEAEFGDELVKVGTPETLNAYVNLLTKEVHDKFRSSLSDRSFLLGGNQVVDALDMYFSRMRDIEMSNGLSKAKKALALHSDNPKAMKLLNQFVPDTDTREDLLAIASEFGPRGLNFNQNIFYSSEP